MSLADFQSKDKESYPSYICVESTEVDYSTKVYSKPTPDKLMNMGNAEKDVSKITEKKKIESWNEKMERQIVHLKKSYIHFF